MTSAVIYLQKVHAWLAETYGKEPASISKPARDLSQDEALLIVMYLHVKGEISLNDIVVAPKVEVPKPGQRVGVKPVIAGVQFYHPKVPAFKNVDLRFVVALWKLSTELKQQFGCTVIQWGGIGVGGDDKPKTDSHHTGRAIDFFGATTKQGKFEVYRDWASKPVPAKHPKGQAANQWPDGVILSYRLQPVTDDPAHAFFLYVYNFATRECQDYSTGKSEAGRAASKIGQSSYIFHPDHPSTYSRKGHQDHMHFHIGTV